MNKKTQISDEKNARFFFAPICKKAQISETMTWVIATLIIIFILAVSIFISSILGTGMFLKKGYDADKKIDLIAMKSLESYLLTSDAKGSGEKIYNLLKDDEKIEELNGENGKLAFQIFKGLYDREYYAIWFGINVKANDYFGPYSQIVAWETQVNRICRNDFISLEKNKFVKLFLCA